MDDDNFEDAELPPDAVENAPPDAIATLGEPHLPECDVVMKGGITSGVVYPGSLTVIGERYRIRGIGGASAGAIGAAVGAAAEFGRDRGGYKRLAALPRELGDGKLAELFRPVKATRPLLRLLLAVTGNDRAGAKQQNLTGTTSGSSSSVRRVRAVVSALVAGFPIAVLIGLVPGVVALGLGLGQRGTAGWLLAAAGVVLALVGSVIAVSLRAYQLLTKAVPENMFGICTGHSPPAEAPSFTDWLSDVIDRVACLDEGKQPLTFGQLWSGVGESHTAGDRATAGRAPRDRRVDLRMMTTCLSLGRPYEMPWDARKFFFDKTQWERIFPKYVIDALIHSSDDAPESADDAAVRRERPELYRLPEAADLPVIVAVRMSLSFPLLISAVPLWTVSRRASRSTGDQPGSGDESPSGRDARTEPREPVEFRQVWFSDGGFCSNFPIHLFDAPLPSRPTFAINLGRFDDDAELSTTVEAKNVRWAINNRQGIAGPYVDIPSQGAAAVSAFASAALNTSRNWQDSTQLGMPGARDRIVRVLHTKREGGLNLHMEGRTIARLSERGAAAATAITDQFGEIRYHPAGRPSATGWENHQWVRYRAFLAALPQLLRSWALGRRVFTIDPAQPPSYPFRGSEHALASTLTEHLDDAADALANAGPSTVDGLASTPRPTSVIRRVPQL